MHTKAPFMLFISQPSSMMWSIKGLFDFYSTQAVMRHLWEANFKSHFGSPLCYRCYATTQTHKSSVIAPIWKSVCVRASCRLIPPLFGKMQMCVIKSNHRCLPGYTVREGCNMLKCTLYQLGFFACVLNTYPTTHVKLRSRQSDAGVVLLASQPLHYALNSVASDFCRSIKNSIRVIFDSRTSQDDASYNMKVRSRC